MARTLILALIIMALVAMLPAPFERHAAAQTNGGSPAVERDRGSGQGRRRDRGPGGGRGGQDQRPTEPRAAAPKAAAESSTSFGTLSDNEKYAKSATDVIKRNDKNGDGILDGDEIPKVGMSKDGDMNGDGKITQPELVAFYRGGLSKPASTSSAAATTPGPGSKSATGPAATPATKDGDTRKFVNTKRKSYRFKTTKERLPTWQFASRDANGDGQVSMSEYSRVWSDRTAADFQRYDRNNDGMITAKESR
jgi:Ca2+-binding EF-hand superfamily protein